MLSRRKRRAIDDRDANVKISRKSETAGDDIPGDVSTLNPDVTSRTASSNGDTPTDWKQSPRRDQRHSCTRESATSSPDVDRDDEELDVVETEDAPADDLGDLFCVDCQIQFTSPGTYRAHRSYYCKRRGKRDESDVVDEDAVVRRRRRASGSGTSVTERSHSWSDDIRPPAGIRPTALFPPSLSALSSPAALMEMFNAAGAPPPPPPGAFFLAPFLAAAAAAAAAAAGLPSSGTVQQSPMSVRPLQPPSADRRSSTSVSDDEPLDLSTCRNTAAADSKIVKHGSVSPAAAAVAFPRHFDTLDTSSLFLAPSARLPPLNASVPLPVVRQTLNSPPSISHCAECNIVFYKHANYLAHKAHYCAGRHAVSSADTQDQTGRVYGPASKSAATLKSDDGSTALDNGRRRSPEPHELVATLDDTGTTIQFYCIPCKIKFSNLDTLRAHKQFYCPARFDATPSGSELATTTRHRHATSRVYNGAEESERQAGDLASAGGSCAACGVTVTSSRSGHRCPAAASTSSLFQCPHCDYAAQSDSRLVEHVRAHAPSRAFRCALCGYRGNTVRGMRMHGKMHNDEAAAAAAGRGGSAAVQLPTFTDDCVIEYEEPPAIPPRRTATGGGGTAVRSGGVDTELLRQKNEPYKRRRSRKAYEKAEYAPPPPTTPVICAECSVPLVDSTHAKTHASAHAAERLLAWETLYGTATIGANTSAPAAVPVCKADVDVTSPVTHDTSVKSAAQTLLSSVKVEQPDHVEQRNPSTDNVDDDDDDNETKCNGIIDVVAVDDQKSAETRHHRRAVVSPSDDVDVPTRPDSDNEEDGVPPVACTVGHRSPPALSDAAVAAGRPARAAAVPGPTAGSATRRTSSLDVASRYCEQCDITFMYASTFIAHKKYYCSSHAAERTEAAARVSATTGVAV